MSGAPNPDFEQADQIGEGGMGEVYRAHQKTLGLVLDVHFTMYGLCFAPMAVAALNWPPYAFHIWSAAAGLATLLLVLQWKLRFCLRRIKGRSKPAPG